MDWHFRVHQRMIEAEKRGQHRSWYVDEADWARSVETVDLDQQYEAPDPGNSGNNNSGSSRDAAADGAGGGGAKMQYIPVPDEGDTTNSVCPICQEKFETKWLDEAQEWVWTDALRVGGRAYHASCYAEVTKGGGGGGGSSSGMPMQSRATPDPVLGKRKAEVSLSDYPIRTCSLSCPSFLWCFDMGVSHHGWEREKPPLDAAAVLLIHVWSSRMT